MELHELRKQVLKPETILAIDIGVEILGARVQSGLTQAKLAKLLKTKQPSIARAERGRVMASWRLLSRIAQKTNHDIIFHLLPKPPKGVSFVSGPTTQTVTISPLH